MILAKGTGGIIPQPLTVAPARESYRVDRISGPDQHRLCELGLVEGAEFSVLNRSQHGMLVIRLGGCRLALARGMADHVWVK